MMQNLKKKWILLVLAFTCLHITAGMTADENITLGNKNFSEPAYSRTQYFDTGLQQFEPEQIMELPESLWKPTKDIPPLLSLNEGSALWYRIIVANPTPSVQSVYLSSENILLDIDRLAIQSITHGKPQRIQSHFVSHRTQKIELPAESISRIYLMAKGRHSAATEFILQDEKSFNSYAQTEELVNGLINGIIAGLSLYSLILYLKTREKHILAYTFLGLCNLITIATYQDIGYFFEENLRITWTQKGSFLFPIWISIAINVFVRLFFDARNKFPKSDRIIKTHILICLAISTIPALHIPATLAYPPFIISTFITTIATFYIFISSGLRNSAMIACGYFMPVLCVISIIAIAKEITPREGHYLSVIQLFNAAEMMFFSMGIAMRIDNLHKIKNIARKVASEENTKNLSASKIISHINHEIRTPLNGIIGAAELLQEKCEERSRNTYKMIRSTSLSLKKIIDDMLNENLTRENRQKTSKDSFSIESVVKECFDLFAAESAKKSINTRLTILGDAKKIVTGDSLRIRQILINLIGNAFKFTKEGEITVEVRQDNANPRYYTFSIIDSGQGISKEDEEKIFQRFGQGKEQPSNQGSGLGLNIVQDLSSLLGGECGFTRNATKGCTFWFTARLEPAYESNQPASQTRHTLQSLQEQSVAQTLQSGDIDNEKHRILIAEDNPTSQLVLEAILDTLGFSCDICNNGSEAEQLFLQHLEKGQHYSAIFMDCEMPVQDGFITTKSIRNHESSHNIKIPTPIIAVTAHTEPPYQTKSRQAGMNAYVTKPITIQAIRETLSNLQLLKQEQP
ncbi:MAG TPA: ATP-binding protein [Pseudomonadales bacterium]|nr:ATP-binding protein [Pseudomonadales bacterium]